VGRFTAEACARARLAATGRECWLPFRAPLWHEEGDATDRRRSLQTIRQGTPTELWQTLIDEGAQRRGVRLDEQEACYLGFVLQRHQRDAQFAAHTLALDWLAAQEEIGRTRADALRDVGDRCLLVAGLFPRLAERRRVSPQYFVALGQDAYGGVADCSRAGYGELFGQLARAFARLVAALGGMRQGGTPPLLPDLLARD
jgi:hypothetical protein